jgi:hypothetical protein
VIAGGMHVLELVLGLLGVWLLVRALVETVSSDGYGQRPPPSRHGADSWQR